MFKLEILKHWIVLQQGRNHSEIDEEPIKMARPRTQPSTSYQRGFSLIELMISLTIGLVIAIAAMSAYIGSSSASKVADAQARMNEDAQAALSVLTRQLRMAGDNPVQPRTVSVSAGSIGYERNPVYLNTYVGGSVTAYTSTLPTLSPGTYTLSSFAIRGCDGTFSNVTTAANLDALTCSGTSTNTLPDSIAVNYETDTYNTVASGGSGTDCLGNAVPTINATFANGTATPSLATFGVADNRFYIASANSIPSLYCRGNTNSQVQPLVENIEFMQFSYGTASTAATSTTATVAGYLSASDIAALATGGLTADAVWGKVLTVKICVVARSEKPILPDNASQSYYKCDGTLDTSQNDHRLRHAYSTVVVLRNRRL